MRHRPIGLIGLTRAAVLAGIAATAGAAHPAAQSSARTAWGDPDLQGVYTFATITPLQRPDDVDGRELLSAEEAASFEERTALERVDRPPRPGDTGTYNRFWVDYGTRVVGTLRTSLIVDPPDGRLPPPAGAARARAEARQAAGPRPLAGHEDLSITDRCIMGFNAGPPFVPSAYNNTVQLFQTPDHVVILNEMIHDARLVPLDGRPHLDAGIRQWLGDSRGRWEGETLVVETTNFNSGRDMTRGVNIWRYVDPRGAVATSRLVERFTRIDGGTLRYEFTIDDPGTWTSPWTATFPLVDIDGELFEYACHEGNYSAANILAGARADEQRQASAP